MSESFTMYFYQQVENFLKETGCYPEKIILPEEDYKQLTKDRNEESMFSGEPFPVNGRFYKNITIESDAKISNWIIIAPEHN